jgi:hypothetical protein
MSIRPFLAEWSVAVSFPLSDTATASGEPGKIDRISVV